MQLEAIHAALRDATPQGTPLDGWLFYDHHRDPVGERILGLDPHRGERAHRQCLVDPRERILVGRLCPKRPE
jgi:hypothetical protein